MEKKTIGSLIAALRKANGMTRQQLADAINVSNKSVSRWERDESLPDITIIPVLAEIFGVTSDELLRGERNTNKNETEKPSQKGDNQIKHIINSNLTKFKVLTYISFSITIVGMIIMLICGYGFYKAELGFGLAFVCFLISLLLEAIVTTIALSVVNSEEFEGIKLYKYRKVLIRYMQFVIYANVVAIISCLPFITIRNNLYTDTILNFRTWILILPICMLAAAGMNIIISIILSKVIINNYESFLSEDYIKHLAQTMRIKLKFIFTLLILLVITFIAQGFINRINYIEIFTKGKSFDTFEAFKEFIEIPVAPMYESYGLKADRVEVALSEKEVEILNNQQESINYEGTEYKYYFHNHSVGLVTWGIPIKVYTNDDIRRGNSIRDKLNNLFVFFYFLEIIIVSSFYISIRRKYQG